MKHYKKRNNFILRTTYWKCLVPRHNAFEKCTTKIELCNDNMYIKTLYIRLQLQMPLHVPA